MSETKPRLEFGNEKHIQYTKVKAFGYLLVWDWHECDCDECEIPESRCPDCNEPGEPETIDDTYNVVKCKKCGEKACDSIYHRDRIRTIIYNFENPQPPKK